MSMEAVHVAWLLYEGHSCNMGNENQDELECLRGSVI